MAAPGAVLGAVLFLLIGSASSFRIEDPRLPNDTSAPPHFEPHARGGVGVRSEGRNPRRTRVNEGNPFTLSQPNIFQGVHARQRCPGMVNGSDGHAYCSAQDAGYCDRRSGACFCFEGYAGEDCSSCETTYFRDAGGLCAPRALCPNDCSGGGTCDPVTGGCTCQEHRLGADCGEKFCQGYDEYCEECDQQQCSRCTRGFFVSPNSTCISCAVYDPRCTDCNAEQCLLCTDPLLTSVRRSGRRVTDPPLPFDEYTRQLSRTLPFGTQSPYAFEEAETFYLTTDLAGMQAAGVEFSDEAWRDAGAYEFDGTPGAQDPYTLAQPPPPTVYREGHLADFLGAFNEKRGLAADGSLPLETAAALAAQRNGSAASVPWFHNLTAAYDGIVLLRDASVACGQGVHADSRWSCAPLPVSHIVCGHPGTLQWTSPVYVVREDQPFFRVAVSRSGGGLGRVTVRYEAGHESTDSGDMTPMAAFTATQLVTFEEGVVLVSFLIAINDDLAVEGDERFVLYLADPDGGASIGAQGVTQVTILDDDAARLAPAHCTFGGPAVDRAAAARELGSQDTLPRLAGVAGQPLLFTVSVADSSGLLPATGAAAWEWPEGGVSYAGEAVEHHRWLFELWTREGVDSTALYDTVPGVDPGVTAAADWGADADSWGVGDATRPAALRPGVQHGAVVYGPRLAALLAARAAGGSTALAGVDFGMALNLTSSDAPGWGALDTAGVYAAYTVPVVADDAQARVWHGKPGGLLGEYFANPDLNGAAVVTRVDYGVNFTFFDGEIAGRSSDYASVRWSGAVVLGGGDELDAAQDVEAGQGTVPVTFTVQGGSSDQARLWVDRQLVLEAWGDTRTVSVGANGTSGSIPLQLHATHAITLEWRHVTGDATVRLQWAYDTGGVTSVVAVPAAQLEAAVIPPAALFSLRRVGSAPLPVTLQPSPPHAGTLTGLGAAVEGVGLMRATAARPAAFQVHSRDALGNARGAAGASDVFAATLTLQQSSNAVLRAGAGALLLNDTLFATAPGADLEPLAPPADVQFHFDHAAALHRGEYSVVAAGQWTLQVALWDPLARARVPLPQAPFSVMVTPGPAAPHTSLIAGPGLLGGVAGEAAPVAMRLRDADGNLVPGAAGAHGQLRLLARHDGSGAQETSVAVNWHACDYVASWLPTLAGTYTVHVRLEGREVGTSPASGVFVTPAATSAGHSVAEGGVLQTMVANVPNTFTVLTRDRFGNVRTAASGAAGVGQDAIAASFFTPAWPELNASITGAQSHLLNVTAAGVALAAAPSIHLGDDAYSVSIAPALAGPWHMAVSLGGAPVAGSPFAVHVLPGATVPAACVVLPGNGTVGGTAGQELTVTVVARDGSGNTQTRSDTGAHIDDVVAGTVTLVQPAAGSGNASALGSPPVTVSALGMGVYRLRYTPVLAGRYTLDVTVNGGSTKNGTVSGVVVSPASISAVQTVVGGNALQGAAREVELAAGQRQALTFLARDEFGNDLGVGGDATSLMVTWTALPSTAEWVNGSTPAGGTVELLATHLGGGRYEAPFTPQQAGQYATLARLATPHAWDTTLFALPRQVTPVAALLDSAVAWDWGLGGPSATPALAAAAAWSAEWNAAFLAEETALHQFVLQAEGRATLALWAGGPRPYAATVAAAGASPVDTVGVGAGATPSSSAVLQVHCQAGLFYPLRLRYEAGEGRKALSLRLLTPGNVGSVGLDAASSTAQQLALAAPLLPLHQLFATALAPVLPASAVTARVVPAAVHPAACLPAGAALHAATVDVPATFTLRLADEFGNVAHGAAPLVQAQATWLSALPGGDGAPPAQRDHRTVHVALVHAGSGWVHGTYTPRATGVFSLAVTVGAPLVHSDAGGTAWRRAAEGFHAAGSPFRLEVINSSPYAARSTAEGPGLLGGVAGVPTAFSVQVRDSGGNVLTAPAPGGVAVSLAHADGPANATVTVQYTGAGQYSVSLMPRSAGVTQIHATVAGVAIADSPFTANVAPALADAPQCSAPDLVPLQHEVLYAKLSGVAWRAGVEATFGVFLRDSFGNALTRGGDALTVAVTGPGSPRALVSEAGNAFAVDGTQRQDGQLPPGLLGVHQVSLTLPAPGRYLLHLGLASGTTAPHGLLGEYWTNRAMHGQPTAVVVDSELRFQWAPPAAAALSAALGGPALSAEDRAAGASDPVMLPRDAPLAWGGVRVATAPGAIAGHAAVYAAVRWSGFLRAPAFAQYTLYAWADDGVRVFIDGVPVLDALQAGPGLHNATLPTPLAAGQLYPIVIEYVQNTGVAQLALAWSWTGRAGVASPLAPLPPTALFPRSAPVAGSPFVLLAT